MKKIYILHGWAYTSDKWKPLVSLLESKGFEVNLLKIPGLTAPLTEVWNLDNYVTWLENILVNEKEVILLGHSNGGRISLAYSAKHPEKVSKLVLIDSAGIYHNEIPIRLKRFIFGRAAKLGKLFTNSLNLKTLLYKISREHDYEQADPVVRETMLNLIRSDITQVLPDIQTPTTIIWGENDKVTPLSDGRLMQTAMTNAELHIVKEARHSPMFTHVNEVTDIIINALSSRP